MIGYGGGVFTAGNYYFWVPLIACPLGGVLGSVLYKVLIEMHWPVSDEDSDEKSEYLVQRTGAATVHIES